MKKYNKFLTNESIDIELESSGMALLAVASIGSGNVLSNTLYILSAGDRDSNSGSIVNIYGANSVTVTEKTGLIFSVSASSNIWANVCVLYL